MTTKQASFNVSKADAELIHQIAKKAKDTYGGDLLNITMDITACHANGNPLNLQKLLEADDFTFGHDIIGIARHINRQSGELMNLFSPRCSA